MAYPEAYVKYIAYLKSAPPIEGFDYAEVGAPREWDHVTLLTPCDERGKHSGKMPGKAFRNGIRTQFGFHLWHLAETRPVSDIHQLSAVLSGAAEARRAFPIHGSPNREGPIRRTSSEVNGPDRHLDDFPHFYCCLDLDGIGNDVWQMDPRTCSVEAIAERLRSLLPPALAGATCHFELSSSTCMEEHEGKWRAAEGAPQRLDAHVWLWFSVLLDGTERKEMMAALNVWVKAVLRAAGVLKSKPKPIDPKVSEPHMPLYVASPRFSGTTKDPLKGKKRHMLLPGAVDVVDMEALCKQLGMALPFGNDASAKPARAPKTPKTPKVARAPREQSGCAPTVLPLLRESVEAMEIIRGEGQSAQGGEGHLEWCQNKLFPARALVEMLALAQDRWARGVPGWEHGVPEGIRNDWMSAIGSLAIERMPLGLDADQVRSRLRMVAVAAGLPMSWYEGEWLQQYDTAAIARYVEWSDAGGKPTRRHGGRDCIALYRYRLKSIVPLCDATVDEADRLKLRSVSGRAIAASVARLDAGGKSREDYESGARRHDADVAALIAEGTSEREICRRLTVDRGTVRRALARLRAGIVPVSAAPQVEAGHPDARDVCPDADAGQRGRDVAHQAEAVGDEDARLAA